MRSISQVVDDLHALGVEAGDVLLVHTSFRAVRPVERGPLGLIEALSLSIGSEGTLVMPSWTGDDDQPFDPATTAASTDLGVVANTFWQQPSVLRSDHPFAFAAKGPKAAHILSDPLILPPHQHQSPVGKVLDCNGKVLLFGTHHDANTTLHLAESFAGVRYGVRNHITMLRDNQPTRMEYFENDHCCELFNLADAWLREAGFQSEGTVGHASARLMRSKDVVELVVAKLRHVPFVFLHPRGSGCAECEDAWQTINT